MNYKFLLLLIAGFINSNSFTQDSKSIRTKSDSLTTSYKSKSGPVTYLDEFFNAPVVRFEKLRYPPVEDYETLFKRINNFRIKIDDLEKVFDDIDILYSLYGKHILTIAYKYNSRIDTVFAYHKSAKNKIAKKTGIVMIPGSGFNQSSAMMYDVKNNSQKLIDDFLQNYGDVHILVKPNEDFLAIHNGIKKIDEVGFVNYLINEGYSYSAYYMVQSVALSKFVKSQYEKLTVTGHSQGGLAALYNVLQSKPDNAVIASGYSVLMDNPYLSGHNQIILPEFGKLYNSETIKNQLKKMKTQVLFTWGRLETSMYGYDAKEKVTQKFFQDLPNVHTFIHQKGHVYHDTSMLEFLGK